MSSPILEVHDHRGVIAQFPALRKITNTSANIPDLTSERGRCKDEVDLLNSGIGPVAVAVGPHVAAAASERAAAAAIERWSLVGGGLDDVETVTHEVFGLEVPKSCPGVPDDVLDPRKTWKDGGAYDAKAKDLAKQQGGGS